MALNPFRRAREKRERALDAADRWRLARKLADDDVTTLGEELSNLHVDTLASDLDDRTNHHYRRALEHYEQAKDALAASTTAEDVLGVEQLLADARYHRAAVLALEAGEPLPARREPCFFDPRHGPSMRDVSWSPPSGVTRIVSVCAADARRLEGGEPPQTRLVRVGDRYVPVHEAGGVVAITEEQRMQSATGSGIHNTQSVADAYVNQGNSGANGAGGILGG